MRHAMRVKYKLITFFDYNFDVLTLSKNKQLLYSCRKYEACLINYFCYANIVQLFEHHSIWQVFDNSLSTLVNISFFVKMSYIIGYKNHFYLKLLKNKLVHKIYLRVIFVTSLYSDLVIFYLFCIIPHFAYFGNMLLFSERIYSCFSLFRFEAKFSPQFWSYKDRN